MKLKLNLHKHHKSLQLNFAKIEKVLNDYLSTHRHLKKAKLMFLELHFIGNPQMRKINSKHRGIDKSTDVLSFPMLDHLRAKSLDREISRELKAPEVSLGDILICLPVARAQSKKFDVSLEQEVLHLLSHGLLHLLGYDHDISEKEATIMQAKEDELVKFLYKKLGIE